MRIEKVEGFLIGSDLVGANYVARITTDTGLTGIGQSGAWGFPDAAAKVVEQYAEYLIGQDPFRIEHIQQSLYRLRPFRGNIVSGALSAVDIALWDIKGKHFEVPVWELLGGRVRDRVRLHLLIDGATPDEIGTAARAAAADGFTAIKFDPFPQGYQDQTMARVIEGVREMAAAARDAVGLDVDLIFELHRKLRATDAVAIADALADFRPLFIEDPVQIDSIPIQADLARRFRFPLANGERLNTIWEFRDLFAAGGPQHVRPDVGNAGGLTGARKIAVLAEAHHSALVTHNYLGPLLTAASVHLDVAIPNFVTQEYQLGDESSGAGNAIFVSSLIREGGFMLAPEAPGIGVELDDARLDDAPPKHLRPMLPLREDGSPSMAI
jgi:galactonate dehydratase